MQSSPINFGQKILFFVLSNDMYMVLLSNDMYMYLKAFKLYYYSKFTTLLHTPCIGGALFSLLVTKITLNTESTLQKFSPFGSDQTNLLLFSLLNHHAIKTRVTEQ